MARNGKCYGNNNLTGEPMAGVWTNVPVHVIADLGDCYLVEIKDAVGCMAKDQVSETKVPVSSGGGSDSGSGAQWGYSLSNGKLIFNARSETASDKGLFADGMKRRRCLIPADSYFEWQHLGKEKQKFEIEPDGASGFCLAGIYRIEQGRAVFSILTREPAQSIVFIHDRMPVILPTAAAEDWLNPRYLGSDILRSAVLNMRYQQSE